MADDAGEQVEPHRRERPFPQLARRFAAADEAPVLRRDRARVPAVGEVIDRAAGDGVALEDRPLDRGDAAVARQQRRVVADAAQLRSASASLLTRACVWAATMRSVPSGIASPGTIFLSTSTCTGTPAACAARASRSSRAGTTIVVNSTPASLRRASNTVAPK
jgi:hypothetical protein